MTEHLPNMWPSVIPRVTPAHKFGEVRRHLRNVWPYVIRRVTQGHKLRQCEVRGG